MQSNDEWAGSVIRADGTTLPRRSALAFLAASFNAASATSLVMGGANRRERARERERKSEREQPANKDPHNPTYLEGRSGGTHSSQ